MTGHLEACGRELLFLLDCLVERLQPHGIRRRRHRYHLRVHVRRESPQFTVSSQWVRGTHQVFSATVAIVSVFLH